MAQIPFDLHLYKCAKLVTNITQPRKCADKVGVFSDVTPSGLVSSYLHFGGTCCLHLHVFYCREVVAGSVELQP
jgi:hypothetical protein